MSQPFGKNLKRYIGELNSLGAIYGKGMRERLDPNKPGHRDEIKARLESDLSPENLWMDGEASPAWVAVREPFLLAAKDELEAYYPD